MLMELMYLNTAYLKFITHKGGMKLRCIKWSFNVDDWWNRTDRTNATLNDFANDLYYDYVYSHPDEQDRVMVQKIELDEKNFLIRFKRKVDGDELYPVLRMYCSATGGKIANSNIIFEFGMSDSTMTRYSTWANSNHTSYYRLNLPQAGAISYGRMVKFVFCILPKNIGLSVAYSCNRAANFVPHAGLITSAINASNSNELNAVIEMPKSDTGASIRCKVSEGNVILNRYISPAYIEDNAEGIMIYPYNDGTYKVNGIYYSSGYFTLMNNLKAYSSNPTEYGIAEKAFTINSKAYDMFQPYDSVGKYNAIVYESEG